MSPVMTFRIAFKALGRNKMRTGSDDARDDHRRRGGDHARRDGQRRAVGDRRSDQGRRHEHDHGQRRQRVAGRRARRLGHVEHADRRRRRRDPERDRRRAVRRGRRADAGAGRGRQPELVHAHPGHGRRPAAHSRVADAASALLQRAGRVTARPRSPCSARRSATRCSASTRIRSARSSASAISPSRSSA